MSSTLTALLGNVEFAFMKALANIAKSFRDSMLPYSSTLIVKKSR